MRYSGTDQPEMKEEFRRKYFSESFLYMSTDTLSRNLKFPEKMTSGWTRGFQLYVSRRQAVILSGHLEDGRGIGSAV